MNTVGSAQGIPPGQRGGTGKDLGIKMYFDKILPIGLQVFGPLAEHHGIKLSGFMLPCQGSHHFHQPKVC